MRLVFATAVLMAAVLVAPPSQATSWQKEESWSVAGRPSVRIETNDAHVSVHRGAAGTVSARVVYELRTWGWSSTPSQPKVDLSRNGDAITIVARARGNIVVFGGAAEDFRIDVTVPENCSLDVRSSDGAIDVEPLNGEIRAEAGDGHIRVRGLRGRIHLQTGDGAIDADDLDGALDARSVDGHLRVSGRFDELDLHTGDGRLDATVRQGSKLAAPWNLGSGDGSLTLRIPKQLQAFIDAACADGHLRIDLPIRLDARAARNALSGELNGGRVPLRMRTGDGTLTLGLAP